MRMSMALSPRYSDKKILTLTLIKISKIETARHYHRLTTPTEDEELARSIENQGILSPPIVRSVGDQRYAIVAGNRRYTACKKLGWAEINCHVIEVDEKEAFGLSLTENIQRRSLNPIEEAGAFDAYHLNYGWGAVSELAFNLGKSISYVDRRMRLLKLPLDVVMLISSGKLSPSAADELLPLNDEKQQSTLAHMVHVNRLSTRRLRMLKKSIGDPTHISEQKYRDTIPLQLSEIDELTQRTFDKSISIIRNALSQLDEVIAAAEGHWILHELLMEHRRALHNQIDILIKEKRKV
jgi:ParB family transcriptional regulator, chromosome partitioning protein